MALINPIPLPLSQLAPLPENFRHAGVLHGQPHVARVMIHAFRLVEATGAGVLAVPLWAAVFLHDLARTHDGVCRGHGADAWDLFQKTESLQNRLAAGGVRAEHWPAIQSAVTFHSRWNDVPLEHPHYTLIALLKDADGLDRIRLGDLDISYLRHPEAVEMVDFAERLYFSSSDRLTSGADYFEQLWLVACRLEASPS